MICNNLFESSFSIAVPDKFPNSGPSYNSLLKRLLFFFEMKFGNILLWISAVDENLRLFGECDVKTSSCRRELSFFKMRFTRRFLFSSESANNRTKSPKAMWLHEKLSACCQQQGKFVNFVLACRSVRPGSKRGLNFIWPPRLTETKWGEALTTDRWSSADGVPPSKWNNVPTRTAEANRPWQWYPQVTERKP